MLRMKFLFVLLVAPFVAFSATLDDVKKRGTVRCGVDGGLPGFAAPDDRGLMRGIDADVCYAVAAAVLGDARKTRFTPLNAKERFTALSSGEVDILSRNTTHTLKRDTDHGIYFTYYNYIDGQGFMVPKKLGATRVEDLNGARICVQSGTTTELNLADYFRSRGLKFTPVGYDTSVQTREGYERGSCDVLTSDKSQLAAIRSELKSPDDSVILATTISKEPLGPAVKQGDEQWFNIVRWSLYALMNAEELGVNSKNVERLKETTQNPEIRRMLGTEGNLGKGLGLDKEWAFRIIKQVGNYGEIYEKNIAPLGLIRAGSPNALWNQGGLLYAPPIR